MYVNVFTGIKLDLMEHFCFFFITIRALEQKLIHQREDETEKMSKNIFIYGGCMKNLLLNCQVILYVDSYKIFISTVKYEEAFWFQMLKGR